MLTVTIIYASYYSIFFSFEGLSKKASLVCGLKVNLIDIYIVVMTVTTSFIHLSL